MSGPHATIAHMRPLQKGWEWVPLGKYVENHDGRRIPISKKERESRSGLFPYYGASGVIDTIDGFTHDGEFLLIGEDGANLLTRSKPLAFLTKGKVWVNNHAHVLRCKPGYSNAYLAYFINSIDLAQYVTGTAQPKLSQSMMNKILIPVAPPEQQVEIVAELEKQFSRLDEAVANLQRVKVNLKRYKACALQAAIEGRLVLGSEKPVSIPLKALIGKIAQGWSPKCELNRDALPDEWAIITTTAVQPMQYLDNQGKPLPSKFEPRPHLEIKTGDFLVTRKGPRKRAGVACLVRTTRHRLMVCDTVYRFRCDESKVLPGYLELVLNAPTIIDAIDKHKAGISESGVSLTHDKLGSVLVPVPSKTAQAIIVAEVDRCLSIVRGVEAEVDVNIKRAHALRQATLSKAFS